MFNELICFSFTLPIIEGYGSFCVVFATDMFGISVGSLLVEGETLLDGKVITTRLFYYEGLLWYTTEFHLTVEVEEYLKV